MRVATSIAAAALAAISIPAAAQSMTAAQYVAKAGAGDLYERASSEIVLKSTTNPSLKTFAQMMVTDHTQSTADVKAAAMAAKLKVAPPKLDADQAKMIADLRAAQGSARDEMYVAQQMTAHNEALALHQGFANDGTAPPLKAVAARIAPTVQRHIDMLAAM